MPKARNLEFDHLMGAAEAAFEPTILLRRIFTTIKQKTYLKKTGFWYKNFSRMSGN